MVFSSITFLLFFLPSVLGALALLDRRYHNAFLLVASLAFYAWGEGVYLALMLWCIAFNHLAGLLIDRVRKPWLMGIIVAIDLVPLVYFKYAAFLLGTLQNSTGLVLIPAETLASIHLPIGISFCTFHSLSYVIDVYRRTTPPQRDPVKMGLYVALFPQLVAGPIVRYNEIAPQLGSRTVRLAQFGAGCERFVYGLAKKIIIANPLGALADAVFALPHQGCVTAWLGILAYTLQIYFDFSAYSDMAIGLGRMLGFTFPENFNYPYISRSIQEFWHRWHLSLSHWFRDYVYFPLGGSRGGRSATYRNLLIIFVLCGLWHGANWTFLVWGLWHGGFLVLERLAGGAPRGMRWRPLQHLYALAVVMIGWVFFRSDDLTMAVRYLGALVGLNGLGSPDLVAVHVDGLTLAAAALGAVFALPAGPWLSARLVGLREPSTATRPPVAAALVDAARSFALAVLLWWCIAQLGSGTYNPFIYFRF